jgi:hypothetical protein
MSDPAHLVSELLISGTLEALQRAAASGGPDIRLGCVTMPLLLTLLFCCGSIELLRYIHRTTSTPDDKPLAYRSFLQALLPQLQQLAPLLRSGNTGKELFLRLLSRLLSLSARTVLSPAQPAFGFVLDSYVNLLSTK